MKKLVVEFIGTFFLVFVIGMTVIAPDAGMFAPLAIGATLMVMVYAGGHISGGHYNPAVSFGAYIRGALPAKDLVPYWAAQIIGGVAAYGMVVLMKGYHVATSMHFDLSHALIAELLGAFALVFVVLSTATSKKIEGNSFYGLAIGFTVTVMAYALGGISGGAFNPAVAIGLGSMNILPAPLVWTHIVANLAGGALAAMTYVFVTSPCKDKAEGECCQEGQKSEGECCCGGHKHD